MYHFCRINEAFWEHMHCQFLETFWVRQVRIKSMHLFKALYLKKKSLHRMVFFVFVEEVWSQSSKRYQTRDNQLLYSQENGVRWAVILYRKSMWSSLVVWILQCYSAMQQHNTIYHMIHHTLGTVHEILKTFTFSGGKVCQKWLAGMLHLNSKIRDKLLFSPQLDSHHSQAITNIVHSCTGLPKIFSQSNGT